MLRLQNISAPVAEIIELDDYIPIIIQWGNDQPNLMTPPPLYWGLGYQKSLLEISLYEQIHLIKIFQVVFTGQVIINEQMSRINSNFAIDLGLIALFTDNWNAGSYLTEYHFRKEGRFEFYLGNSYLRVTLTKHKTLDQIVAGKIRFCITEDNSLSSLGVYDLSAKEMNQTIGRLKHGQTTISGRVEN